MLNAVACNNALKMSITGGSALALARRSAASKLMKEGPYSLVRFSSQASSDPTGQTEQDHSSSHSDERVHSSQSCSTADPDEDPRTVVKQALRQAHVAEVAAHSFYEGQALLGLRGPRVDLQYFRDQEAVQLDRVRGLVAKHRARPSLLHGVFRAGGLLLGAAAAVAPRRVNLAIAGAVQDALTELHTDKLRDLRESGAAQQVPDVREALRALRDVERAPEGAPVPPDLLALQRMKGVSDLGVEGAVGALVKAGAQAALGLAKKL
mmetsp:Transcript_5718/g.12632  ORF Transcript_5718/g.12632 Transcript_5718/m.12632 type:complete len:265 (+) Transcript_5718:51-845(+)